MPFTSNFINALEGRNTSFNFDQEQHCTLYCFLHNLIVTSICISFSYFQWKCITMSIHGSFSNFLFSNIKFLLIILELHIMHPGYTHSPFLPHLPTHAYALHQKKKKTSPTPICVSFIIIGTASGQPLKENWILPFPTSCQKLSMVKSYTSASLSYL